MNLTDGRGGVRVSYALDPWGRITDQTGQSGNRQIFTGQEHDENTGLIDFGVRYYDPDIARFVTQDPYLGEIGTPQSLNRYLYAYGNPTVYVDLFGYRAATPEEKAELALWEEAAALNQASYESRGIWGKAWSQIWRGSDYSQLKVLEINIRNRKAAIEAAADGEPVEVMPFANVLFHSQQTEANMGDGTIARLWDVPVYITGTEARLQQQFSNLQAAAIAPPAAIAMAIDPDNTAAIQISGAAWEVLSAAAVAMHSRASNPTAKMTIESRSDGTVKIINEPNVPNRLSKEERKALKDAYQGFTQIDEAKIMHELRAKNTPGAHATAKLLKRKMVKMEIEWSKRNHYKKHKGSNETDSTPPELRGESSRNPDVKKFWLYRKPIGDAHEAAGVAVHEVRHLLDKVTQKNYQMQHEIDAYTWQLPFMKYWNESRIKLRASNPKYYRY